MKNLKPGIFFLPFIIAGISLAVYQLLFNRSLWLDEAMLARNIVEKGFWELLQPLDHNQVAPIGFLWTEKLFIMILGPSEFGFRIFPFLCFIFTIPVLYRLTYKLTKQELAAWLATAFFSCSVAITINYSSELKQYMCDVFFCVLILYVTISIQESSKIETLILTLTGIIALLFSNISILFLFPCGLYLLYAEVYQKRNYYLFVAPVVWVIIFGIYYLLFIHHHPTQPVMLSFWKNANAFAPLNIFSAESSAFMKNVLTTIFRDHFGFDRYWPHASIVTGTTLLYLLITKKFRIVFLLLVPITCHYILSMFMLYPFFGRLILYTTPLLAIVLATGFTSLYEAIKLRFKKIPAILLCIPLLAVCNYMFEGRFPLEKEEIKHSINYVDTHIRPEQTVYIYYGAIQAYSFYKETGKVQNKNITINAEKRKQNETLFLSQINNLSGEVWLIFAHVKPYNEQIDEEKYTIDLLLKKGGKILDKQQYTGSNAYLIQL